MGWLKYGEAKPNSQQWWSHSVGDHLLHVGTWDCKYVAESVSRVLESEKVWRSGRWTPHDLLFFQWDTAILCITSVWNLGCTMPRTAVNREPNDAPHRKAINNSADKTAHLYCIYVAVGVVSQHCWWSCSRFLLGLEDSKQVYIPRKLRQQWKMSICFYRRYIFKLVGFILSC